MCPGRLLSLLNKLRGSFVTMFHTFPWPGTQSTWAKSELTERRHGFASKSFCHGQLTLGNADDGLFGTGVTCKVE